VTPFEFRDSALTPYSAEIAPGKTLGRVPYLGPLLPPGSAKRHYLHDLRRVSSSVSAQLLGRISVACMI